MMKNLASYNANDSLRRTKKGLADLNFTLNFYQVDIILFALLVRCD